MRPDFAVSSWIRSGSLFAAAVALLALAGCDSGSQTEPADVVLTNGNVVTLDENTPRAEAVAIRAEEIVAVGSAEEMAAYIGDDTEVIDVEGNLVIPGFIEGHGHFMSLGRSKLILDLTGVESWDAIVAMVEEAAASAEPGTWIQGRGWHQEKWVDVPETTVDGVPLHHDLSAASPDHPVILGHASGHATFVNARAMEIAGIDAGTQDPEGGTIVKDASGQPTGLLRETAGRLVSRHLNEAMEYRDEAIIRDEMRLMVELAGEEALRHGVTSFHDAGSSFATIDFFKEMADQGELPVRLYVMVRGESIESMDLRLPEYRLIGYGDHHLTVRSIKRQIDGALGPHGAWLLEPYADLPSSTGLNLEPLDEIRETARVALKHGFQVNTHAIGDRANREVLDIYEAAFESHGLDPAQLRWRIEHAQHVHPDDVPRFAELSLIASMQGIHCTSDAPWVFARLGEERARTESYMWREFHNRGVLVTNGTDVPVEAISPIASYYASVTRRMANGEQFYPEQSMSREEALRSYTINNAYASFSEHLLGSLTPGKLADITVLDRDILTVPEEEILDTQVLYTIVGGDVRFRR